MKKPLETHNITALDEMEHITNGKNNTVRNPNRVSNQQSRVLKQDTMS